MTSAANAMSRAEAPTAAPSGSWRRISSTNATRNLARCSSTRIRAVSTASSSSATTVSVVISEKASPQCLTTAPFPASGRKMKATSATQSSREAMLLTLAGRPTAR